MAKFGRGANTEPQPTTLDADMTPSFPCTSLGLLWGLRTATAVGCRGGGPWAAWTVSVRVTLNCRVLASGAPWESSRAQGDATGLGDSRELVKKGSPVK